MGTLALSGVLKRPVSGDVVPNARITFDAIATGSVVLKGVSSSCKTAVDGSYTVSIEYGDYAIQVSWAGQTQQYGTVHVDDTTPIGSLNDLLMQQIMESQLTPEIILEFRQLEQEMQDDLAQMEQLNDQASESATSAEASESAAGISAADSAASASAAANSAAAADISATSSTGNAQAAADSAANAAQSEANAAASDSAAESAATAAKTSETNSSTSESAAAAAAAAAKTSETNSSNSESSAATSATAAKTSESNSAASEESASTSEINANNARDAAEEYANEAKEASSKVTNPLTDRGTWAIQSGYPTVPEVASIWQIVDGGLDPVNSEIIWDPGDMLVYLATSGVWCRLLGQQTVAGEPKPIAFDSDIILNVGAGLQIVSTGTTRVDVARLDGDNNLVVGDAKLPGIVLNTAEPTNLFVLVPNGSGGFTKSRIYSEAFPPPNDCNVQTNPKDPTPGAVLVNGSWGLGGTSVNMMDAEILGDTPAPSMLFRQGAGADSIHYGGFGVGVHIDYGADVGGIISGNFFIGSDGNLTVEWLQVNPDGSGTNVHLMQRMYGPLNPPTTELLRGVSQSVPDGQNILGYFSTYPEAVYRTAGTNVTNAPPDWTVGPLHFQLHGKDDTGTVARYGALIAHDIGRGTMWVNNLDDMAWGVWRKIYDSYNLPPAIKTVPYFLSNGARPDANTNNLDAVPLNSVVFAYLDTINNPTGKNLTLMDFSNEAFGEYRTQFASSYGDNSIYLRTKNGDTLNWNPFVQLYTTGFETTPEKIGAYPITGGTLNGGLYAAGGDISNNANIVAGSGLYESSGYVRVYSPNNPPPVDGVQNIALGAAGWYSTSDGTTTAPSGCVLTGGGDFGASDGSYTYRPQQITFDGVNWLTVSLLGATRNVLMLSQSDVAAISTQPYELATIPPVLSQFSLNDSPVSEISLLSNNDGYDWYRVRNNLGGNVFIAYHDDTGVIEQISENVQALWPQNLAVAALESLPDGCDIFGTWIFDPVTLTVSQSPERVASKNKSGPYHKFLRAAGDAYMLLQLLPPEDVAEKIAALKEYLTKLQAVDLTQPNPNWPPAPMR